MKDVCGSNKVKNCDIKGVTNYFKKGQYSRQLSLLNNFESPGQKIILYVNKGIKKTVVDWGYSKIDVREIPSWG